MATDIWGYFRKNSKTLSVAESCTGGLLGGLITAVPGSSEYFMGGLIAYSNRVKTGQLGVSKSSLKQQGAVSESVARQMAQNVRRRFKTDYGISLTGIAGPGGGTKNKPVGLVYIAVSGPNKILCKKYLFSGSRARIRARAARAALSLLKAF